MIQHRKVDIKTETALELLRADNAELREMMNTLTARFNDLGNGVIEVEKKDDSELPYGDYLNPMAYIIGDEVEAGKWYYTDTVGKDLPRECVKSGIPASFDDGEYLV